MSAQPPYFTSCQCLCAAPKLYTAVPPVLQRPHTQLGHTQLPPQLNASHVEVVPAQCWRRWSRARFFCSGVAGAGECLTKAKLSKPVRRLTAYTPTQRRKTALDNGQQIIKHPQQSARSVCALYILRKGLLRGRYLVVMGSALNQTDTRVVRDACCAMLLLLIPRHRAMNALSYDVGLVEASMLGSGTRAQKAVFRRNA